jgi:hypothetical protein
MISVIHEVKSSRAALPYTRHSRDVWPHTRTDETDVRPCVADPYGGLLVDDAEI